MTARSKRTDEIRARLEAATPGPWIAVREYTENGPIFFVQENPAHSVSVGGFDVRELHGDYPKHAATAVLIAKAPADLAYLLARVWKLENALAKARDLFAWSGVDVGPWLNAALGEE